ncbi:hypothetical protein MRS44_006697 [Fusarium solani]|uniref:uncharacterized protein n=1 Tax=Fusarium solani TaxID=169388 RepID=UPI0032C48250|nr:hypothetical protein MRS44_006697 [Fusarium solani]
MAVTGKRCSRVPPAQSRPCSLLPHPLDSTFIIPTGIGRTKKHHPSSIFTFHRAFIKYLASASSAARGNPTMKKLHEKTQTHARLRVPKTSGERKRIGPEAAKAREEQVVRETKALSLRTLQEAEEDNAGDEDAPKKKRSKGKKRTQNTQASDSHPIDGIFP